MPRAASRSIGKSRAGGAGASHTLALTTSVPASWMRSVSAFTFSAGRSTRGVACPQHAALTPGGVRRITAAQWSQQ